MTEKNFAIIDTETNWDNEVMSVGVVVASTTFKVLGRRYYVLTPEVEVGGMFSNAISLPGQQHYLCSRDVMAEDVHDFLAKFRVRSIFAYNAKFDYGMLPELSAYDWYDIMRLAAYRQYNEAIPHACECYGTGRMKSGYGVESIFQMLSGNLHYYEKHNALQDAEDELEIMMMLGHTVEEYDVALIN